MKITFITIIISFCMPVFAQKSFDESLKKAIELKTKSVVGDFAVAVKDLQSGKTLFINEKTNFHAASTMKTPVMMEVFKLSNTGKLKLNDSILIKNEFRSIVDQSTYKMDIKDDSGDDLYKHIGTKTTIYNLVYQMITVSSNLATNILIDLVEAKNINNTMRNLGANHIQVLRGVEDQKAFDKGLNNSVTAYDLMLIFEKIATDAFVSKSICEQMRNVLFDQKFNEIIPAKLPENIKVAHKTGSITGVQHDSGIVYLPQGHKYVLILLSKNLKNTDLGVQTMAEISEMIYDHIK